MVAEGDPLGDADHVDPLLDRLLEAYDEPLPPLLVEGADVGVVEGAAKLPTGEPALAEEPPLPLAPLPPMIDAHVPPPPPAKSCHLHVGDMCTMTRTSRPRAPRVVRYGRPLGLMASRLALCHFLPTKARHMASGEVQSFAIAGQRHFRRGCRHALRGLPSGLALLACEDAARDDEESELEGCA